MAQFEIPTGVDDPPWRLRVKEFETTVDVCAAALRFMAVSA